MRPTCNGARTLPLPPANDAVIEAIAERVRSVVSRQPGHTLDEVADALAVPRDAFRELMEQRGHVIDVVFLVDVIAAVVREAGVDPKWLLTGNHDPTMHRHALSLGEDRTSNGARALREFVREQLGRLRDGTRFLSLPRFPFPHD